MVYHNPAFAILNYHLAYYNPGFDTLSTWLAITLGSIFYHMAYRGFHTLSWVCYCYHMAYHNPGFEEQLEEFIGFVVKIIR